ncbi:MAG TPA: glycosyltransferase, partial [Chloroflexota bacterium]|nr:glycosyltransferase [Chloroflexota bacterium]
AARPIVASRVATIPEVVLDGVTGLLVGAGDAVGLAEALGRLADEPELAHGMGVAGRERLRGQFSIEKMVGDTELLYRELLEDRAQPVASARI